MEHCDGEIPSKRPKLSDGGGGGGGDDDRLSALPDDLLIKILIKLLDASVAARTSVLSSRWRQLWRLLPELRFRPVPDPHGVRAALESHEAPALHHLAVDLQDASPESVSAWLRIAARRLSGDLLLVNKERKKETEDEAAQGGALELPCFENATSISLEVWFLGLTLPPSGVFTRLTDIFLAYIKLHGPCMLGDAVSSPRCPVLRKLTVHHVLGLDYFAIHSDSLLEIELRRCRRARGIGLQQLNVVTPALKKFGLMDCFTKRPSDNQPVVNISAPQLESLKWIDDYDPIFMQFGQMKNLQWLSTHPFCVYRQNNYARNNYCLRLLLCFEHVHSLTFMLIYLPDITNQHYLMEDITRLPNITTMVLRIITEGHSFGGSVFHILRMCTGVKMLVLEIHDTTRCPEAHTACPCDQPPNWKTEELALNRLQEVAIHDFKGTQHEAALVKRLFDWATVLRTMTVTFDGSVAESKAKEFCRLIQSFSRPEICLRGPHFA